MYLTALVQMLSVDIARPGNWAPRNPEPMSRRCIWDFHDIESVIRSIWKNPNKDGESIR
jgi:hypothetical protein